MDFYFIKKNEDKLIKFYHQHFFEDSSGLRFDNKWDGLCDLKYLVKNLIQIY